MSAATKIAHWISAAVTPLFNKIYPHQRPLITRAMMLRWSAWSGITGSAMLFRTPVEMVCGIGLLWACTFLVIGAWLGWPPVALLGFGLASVWSFSRVISAPFIPDVKWHSVGIIVGAWGMFSYLTGERAWSTYRKAVGDASGQ